MRWFHNRSATAKLLLSFAAVCCFTIGVGFVGAQAILKIRENLRIVYADYTVAGTDLANVANKLTRYRNLILAATDAADRAAYDKADADRATVRKEILDPLDSYAATELRVSESGRDERKNLEQFRAALDDYLATSDETMVLSAKVFDATTPEEASQLRQQAKDFGLRNAGPKLNAAIASMGELLATVTEVARDMNNAGNATAISSLWAMGIATGLAFVISMVLGFCIARWFSKALLEVAEIATTLASASQQLSAASEEISSGAQEQAANLEETASSLEEITSTVKQNADNAQQANQLANGSREVAEKGGNVVSNAIEGMNEINKASKKIADIITAIDEIAFQTNLLALNAAVEAARAGEQGRGFAVVAGEVRNLAQRSAAAAKEIKGLIQDSVRKVETGSELVNQSGQTLQEIVSSVKRVTDIVAEIAAASREQSAGIDQVSKAVAQMDSVTQANASQTEELSGTAQSLAGQAERLQEVVAQFNLTERVTRPVKTKAAALPKASKPAALKPVRKEPNRNGSHKSNGHSDELDLVGAGAGGNRLNGHFEEF